MSENVLVGIIMGSQSDWDTMKNAAEMLDALGIPYEARVVSAHRTPDRVVAYGVPARHQPLPEALSRGNLPELLLPQTDLWGAQRDDSWKE